MVVAHRDAARGAAARAGDVAVTKASTVNKCAVLLLCIEIS